MIVLSRCTTGVSYDESRFGLEESSVSDSELDEEEDESSLLAAAVAGVVLDESTEQEV